MKKYIIKYLSIFFVLLISVIFYLSFVGLNTEKFNNQIKEKVNQTNNNLEIEIKKIKLTLDPLNLKINAKTIGPNVLYKGINLELEYIESQISLISLIKNKFVSSKLKFSTKSILLKDLVAFIKILANKPELFILENAIKNGLIIVNVDINFDENGEIKQDYKINGSLKNGKIELFKNYNFKKINLLLDANSKIFSFSDLSFITNKTKFFSNNIKITQSKKDFLFEGEIENKNSNLDNELLKLLNLDFKNLNFIKTNFFSKNKFSFNIDNKLKINNLDISSEIKVNKSEYQKPISFDDYFHDVNNLIDIKDHKIKIRYKNNDFTLKGSGKIKLEKDYNEINYTIINKKIFLILVQT